MLCYTVSEHKAATATAIFLSQLTLNERTTAYSSDNILLLVKQLFSWMFPNIKCDYKYRAAL